MLLIRKSIVSLIAIFTLALVFSMTSAMDSGSLPTDAGNKPDTVPNQLPYPIYDYRGDAMSNPNRNPYDLQYPSNYNDSVVYDAITRRYIVYEKIGSKYYRTPSTYSFEEFWAMRNRQAEREYFQRRANTTSILNRGKFLKPKLSLSDNLFNRLFGNGKIDITPQGNVDITAGYQGQRTNNPTLPERARKSGGLDFNMNAQVNVNANIGDKLKFPINYNTLANLDMENQLKLDYSGNDDEILKRFEAGNVSFPSRSTLIPGAQQLFGIKTQLQFGKLYISTVLANQKSQRQSVNLQGGAAAQPFEIKADEYEENRHFLVGQYFYNNYNKFMQNLPAVISPVQILRMEVWITNRNGTPTETRDIVGLMDLAETHPFRQPPTITPLTGSENPSNNNNDLYSRVISQPDARNPAQVFTNLTALGLQPVQDFEKTFARKLDSTQYTFNRQVGSLSLSQPLQPDEVLGVAYQYSYNGKIFQVGEFSQDVPPDSSTATQKVLFLKLLKATSQRPALPIWDLMLKNVYTIGYGILTPTDFKLDVLYQEPGLGAKRYVPFGDKNQGAPIISLINLDRLNSQLDPQPDGVFDYVENFTVVSNYSRVIFPVLEPFGRDLAKNVYTTIPPNVRDTLYYALYDSIKAVAQQFPNLNRYVLKGTARTSGSADISIGFNIPRNSVTVSAGGRTLQEGLDYDINYDLGTIRITNQAILNAGLPVQVNFENNASFGLQQRSYLGLRLDYLVKNTEKYQLSVGGTLVRLSERPFFTKVNLNEDPIRNAMYGIDANFRKDVPRLSKWLDKLPFYSTTAPSTLNVYAEGAMLKPGHAPQIGKGNNGVIYIDDFEGSKSGIDLRFPPISWALASTPYRATNPNTGAILFPEAELNNNLDYGKNRAKIAWYQIEQTLQQYKGPNNPLGDNSRLLSDPRFRLVYQKEIFPQRTTGFGESQLVTFDLAYYPTDRGPYNFVSNITDINGNGKLLNPKKRWGGLMRNIDQTDFETSNIEFIEFWLQDPFIDHEGNPTASSSTGGKLYFNLGNISEDVLKDGRRFYENGLPTPNAPSPTDTTVWGRIPRNPIQVTNAFSNLPEDRVYQDVGFDGLSDTAEAAKRQSYLASLAANFGINSKIYQDAQKDPSGDNYRHYRDAAFGINDGISRYKNFNGPDGNSPISDGGQFSTAATLYPDAEDLNRDNTLSETEEYFQYIVDLKPANTPEMNKGGNFIVDKKVVPVNLANGGSRNETWYQFRIPIGSYNTKVGNIPDFKSIRFIRMFMTGFEDSVVARFATLQLTRNIWRKFQYKLDTTGQYNPPSAIPFNVGAVNIEENDKRTPLPYRTPRDIERVQTQSNNGVNLLQNEQAMTLNFCNLKLGDGKAVFQTFANRDLRQFGKLSMYIHAENAEFPPNTFADKDLTAVIRIGEDFVNNYYEIRIPLINTPLTAASLGPDTDEYNDSLWNPRNSLDLYLQDLTKLKQQRNINGGSLVQMYSEAQPNGQKYGVIGNPNLGEVRGILIGVENTKSPAACGEVWVNELRLSSLDERGGYAALARADVNLADLGTLSVSVNGHTNGFGTLEQRVNERYRDNFMQFDVATNLELGRLLPKKAAMSIPFYASYSQSQSTPEYDPFDLDIKLKDKLGVATAAEKDSIRTAAVDFTSVKTVNFTNVRKIKTNDKKPKLYDISNIDLSYSYINTSSHSPLIEYNDVTRHRGAVGYNFATQPKYIEPFKNIFGKSKTHWFDLIKDFNFNYMPSQLSFRADLWRQFGAIRPRSIGTSKYVIPETYDKFFVFQRDYIARWNFTRSLAFDYTATNNSRIDEPFGRIDTKEEKDSVIRNLLKGGRNTLFNQTAAFSYTLPTSKLPLLDWTTVNLKYQANYRWIGASRLAVELGNFLENGQQKEATVQLDFSRLYQKSKWLKQLDVPGNPDDREKWRNRVTRVTDSVTLKDGRRVLRTRKVVDKAAVPYVPTIPKVFGKLLTSLKQANISFSESANTRLPGYMDSTQYFGQNFKSMAPGFDFILGRQPDTSWLNRKAAQGLITRDTNFNYLFQQNLDQRIAVSATLEPVRDLNISLNMTKSFSKNYNETFRYIDTSGGMDRKFMHLNPYAGGGFDVSYIAFKTLFGKYDPNRVSETFKTFEANRIILSERLGKQNLYSQTQLANGYYYGYNKYAIDVLIPSFIAAYTGQDPTSVPLIKQNNANLRSNPFRNIMPKPNWKVDYTGLSRIKGLDKIFTNFNVSHGYNGNLSMNGFTSALLYQDVSNLGYPSFYDSISNNFIPFFLVPNVSIQEQFAPLIGFDMMFTNQLQARFEYAKSRTLSLSLYDFQLSETRSTEFIVGMGYRKRGLPILLGLKLPKFLSKEGGSKLDNEINFRLDFRIRDNVTANSRLDQDNNFATGGSKEITISPTIDYYLNNRINLKLYFDQRRVKPYVSSSAPTVNTRAGVQVRISLAQ
ncbi:MAG: cell surface protein SprA [Ferruginibacter sp.]